MSNIKLFEEKRVRSAWNEEEQQWYFSVQDVIQILIDSADVKQYVKRMRQRDTMLDANWGTICTPVEMVAADGKKRKRLCRKPKSRSAGRKNCWECPPGIGEKDRPARSQPGESLARQTTEKYWITMKFYWTMPPGIKAHYCQELESYRIEFAQRNLQQAWRHLERAHILAQAWPREHSYVHWQMLRFGLFIKSPREVVGQIPRLLVGGVKSFVGHIPVGNTGGSNVPPLQAMEIPGDLAKILASNS